MWSFPFICKNKMHCLPLINLMLRFMLCFGCVCVCFFFYLLTENDQQTEAAETSRANVFTPNTAGTQQARSLCFFSSFFFLGFCGPVTPAVCEIWIINQQQNIPCARKKKRRRKTNSGDLHKAGGLMSNCEGLISLRDEHVTHYQQRRERYTI